MITPGSDIGIKTIFESFDVKGKNVVTTDYCFPMYRVYSDLYETTLKTAKYTGMRLDVNSILKEIDTETEFVILANPNSPLGDYIETSSIKKILNTGVYLILDEAYIELTDKPSALPLLVQYDNLVITRTFSKGFGAAGCRVGYILSNPMNIEIFNKFRFMYEISGIASKYVENILRNIKFFKKYFSATLKGKEKLVNKLPKDQIINTDSSWFFIKHSDALESLFNEYKVSIRTQSLPKSTDLWFKFNYDTSLKGSKFIKRLINETSNRSI